MHSLLRTGRVFAYPAHVSMRESVDVESSWIVRRSPRAGARMRLYCFAHAGGGSLAFHPWTSEPWPEIEVCAVQLPGRENRLREPAVGEVGPLLERLVAALLPTLDRGPFAFFGHSLGALLAFEVTRALRRRGAPLPRLLIAAGRAAPSHGGAAHRLSAIADDDQFVRAVQSYYGGIPPALLAERELLALIAPILRADLKLAEHYEYRAEPPLPVPIRAFGGDDDPAVDEQALRDWSAETTAGFGVQRFPGGHFFVQESRGALLRAIRTLIMEH